MAAPIISEGDVLGLVLFVEDGEPQVTGRSSMRRTIPVAFILDSSHISPARGGQKFSMLCPMMRWLSATFCWHP